MREQRRRADAQRNSERIVQATMAAFEHAGSTVSLEEIAQRAGVGIATVYRQFGSRERLVRAAFEAYFVTQVEPIAKRAREDSDPWRGLSEALSDTVRSLAGHRALVRAMHESGGFPVELVERYLRHLTGVLSAAQEQGQVRGDLVVRDLAYVLMMTLATVPPADAEGTNWRRYLALLMAGLRAHGEALPPLTRPVPGAR